MKKTALIIIVLIIGCQNKPSNNHTSNKKEQVEHDCLLTKKSITKRILFDSIVFKRWIVDNFFNGLRPKDIVESRRVNEFCLQGYGEVEVELYKVILSEDTPATIRKIHHLVFFPEKEEITMINNMNNYKLIQVENEDTCFFLGGILMSREFGYFNIYQFDRGCLVKVFDSSSDNYCEKGIPVFRDFDCFSYSPPLLRIQNQDVNKDGFMDLIFSGNLLVYCSELERGFTSEDRKPLKQKKINYNFITSLNEGSPQWKLVDSLVCNEILH
ncbi:MAG: hypothetical protein AB8B69_11715 [Chitinophagales bacterium]